jgi:hypothetical protein
MLEEIWGNLGVEYKRTMAKTDALPSKKNVGTGLSLSENCKDYDLKFSHSSRTPFRVNPSLGLSPSGRSQDEPSSVTHHGNGFILTPPFGGRTDKVRYQRE